MHDHKVHEDSVSSILSSVSSLFATWNLINKYYLVKKNACNY